MCIRDRGSKIWLTIVSLTDGASQPLETGNSNPNVAEKSVVRVFADNLVRLGHVYSAVSYIISFPKVTKQFLRWEKVAQMALLPYFVLG